MMDFVQLNEDITKHLRLEIELKSIKRRLKKLRMEVESENKKLSRALTRCRAKNQAISLHEFTARQKERSIQ